jgi:hypothetical protein
VGRSGSMVLTDLLRQRTDMYWDGEIYERVFSKYPYRDLPRNFHVEPYDFIKSRLQYAGTKYYGLTMKFFHIRLTNETLRHFVETLERIGFQYYIVLKRKNILRKIVSSIVAHQTDVYHNMTGAPVSLKQIYIDVDKVLIDRECKPLMSFLEDYEASFSELDKLLRQTRTLYLDYETHLEADPLIAYVSICDFINATPQPVTIRFARTNPFRLQDILVNFVEVEHTLHNTRFEWMLYA